ncbi:MAG: hypothetical protein LM582_08320 [Desulfurococcaceae archaeon]|nr:hypothetical protein [Desulfurococcaceae archaeon]
MKLCYIDTKDGIDKIYLVIAKPIFYVYSMTRFNEYNVLLERSRRFFEVSKTMIERKFMI